MPQRTRKIATTTLPLSKLRTDGGTQPRGQLDPDVVTEYAAAYKAKAQLPPLVVFQDGAAYWLVDGFHRLEALRKNGARTAQVEVHRGTQTEAIWYAAGANQQHGLRRTNEDKQRAVVMALACATKMSPQPSSRQIAEHVGVDHKTVEKYRSQATLRGSSPDGEERVRSDGRRVGRVNQLSGDPPLEEAGAEEPPPSVVVDELGQEITEPAIADAFRTWQPLVAAAVAQLRGISAQFAAFDQEQKAAKSRFREARSYDYARTMVVEELKQLAHNLGAQAPFCVCPYCNGAPRAADPLKRCKGCWGGGWTDKSGWENAPPEKRAAAKASAKASKGARHG